MQRTVSLEFYSLAALKQSQRVYQTFCKVTIRPNTASTFTVTLFETGQQIYGDWRELVLEFWNHALNLSAQERDRP